MPILVQGSIQAQGSILPYLPKDTIVAVSAPDLMTSMADFAKMPLAKMWAEEEVQNFLADVIKLAKKQVEQGMARAKEMHSQGALPFDPEELKKLKITGGTLALTSLALKTGDFGPEPSIGVMLHLDFGDSASTWNGLIQMGLGMLESAAKDEMTKEESMVGDVKMVTLKPTHKQIDMGLNVAFVPNGILIGTLASDLRSVVENWQKKTPVLGASESYLATSKHLTEGGAEVEVFVRFEPLIEFAVQGFRMATEFNEDLAVVDMDGVERALKAMGLRDLGSAGMTSTYVDGKCVTRSVHVHAGAANEASGTTASGANTAAAAKPLDMSFMKWVPKDAVSFSASTMHLVGFYDTLLKGLEAYDPNVAKQALAHLGKMQEQLGFSVREDLFGSIGDQAVSWSMPMATMAAPEIAMLLKVNDEAKLVNAIKKMADLSQGMVEIEEGEKRGLKAYQVHINFDPMNGMGMNIFEMIQPTFAFKDGYLVLGLSASDVKRVFQRMDREDDPKGDIRGNKEFAAVAASIPAGVDSVSFTDWKSNFESLYQMATGLLAFVPMGEDVPIDTSLLPDPATLTKHLFGSVSYSKTTGTTSETVSTSPFGPETALMLAVIVGAGAGFAAANTLHGR